VLSGELDELQAEAVFGKEPAMFSRLATLFAYLESIH
jgi:hypothetical protein